MHLDDVPLAVRLSRGPRPAGRAARSSAIVVALAALAIAGAAGAAELDVRVENRTRPTLCAETDNVTLTFASPAVRRFRVVARHPAYIGTLQVDRFAADWANCPALPAPGAESAPPTRRTLYEDVEWQLVGLEYAAFWRPHLVPLVIDGKTIRGAHLLQLWVRRKERAEEVLVLYPSDGYWRARPLPPAHLAWTAYGSSFLIGPLEEAGGRPIVDIKAITFDPAAKRFVLAFARGGTATLTLRGLDEDAITLDVDLSETIAETPFAAIRSMFVTAINADVAEVMWRAAGAPAWSAAPLPAFRDAGAAEIWAGRLVPSRHNTSAPDMIVGPFIEAPAKPQP